MVTVDLYCQYIKLKMANLTLHLSTMSQICMDSGGIIPHHFNLITIRMWEVSSCPNHFCPSKKDLGTLL